MSSWRTSYFFGTKVEGYFFLKLRLESCISCEQETRNETVSNMKESVAYLKLFQIKIK